MAGDIEAGLWAYLQTKSSITSLVGTRVYSQFMPQLPTFPLIIYTKVAEERVSSHQGSSGLSRATIQIDCWADTDDESRNLAEQVRLVLDGYQGAMMIVTGKPLYI